MASDGVSTGKGCSICHEDFDNERRCPRILECFHTLCTECIRGLIRNKAKRCPLCHQAFESVSAEEVKINEEVRELANYVSFLKRSSLVGSSQDVTDTVPKAPRNDAIIKHQESVVRNLTHSQEAKDLLEAAIQRNTKLRDDLLKNNESFRNTVINIIDEITLQNKEKVKEIDLASCELERRLEEAYERQAQLQTEAGKLENIHSTSNDVVQVLYDVHKSNVAIEEWLKNFKVFISNKDILWQTRAEVMQRKDAKMKVVTDVLRSCLESPEIVSMPALTLQKASPLKMTVELLQELSDPIKCLVGRGKIYVVHQTEKKIRKYSKIYLTEDKMCFGSLREDPAPYNAHFLEYDQLMSKIDPASRMAYLELGTDEATIGRLYVRFEVDSPLAQQFVFLCSGSKGPSYKNTNLLEVYSKSDLWEWVRFGDYENNDGSGGREIVPGQGVAGDIRRPCQAGILEPWLGVGSELASQFLVHIRDNPKTVSLNCSGFVEEGLCVLEKIVRHHPNVREISITDCGLVIPRDLPELPPI